MLGFSNLRPWLRKPHSAGTERDLFKLPGSPTKLTDDMSWPSMLEGDVVSNLIFPPGAWSSELRTVERVTFRHVSFSKVTMSRRTFKECLFEECLFLGTTFRDVEFHGCDFIDCNFWKAHFRRVYVDPNRIVLGKEFKTRAANAGISLYHALIANFANERQTDFLVIADMKFRRWKRYQLRRDLRVKRIGLSTAVRQWMWSAGYELAAGFGYRPGRAFIATILLFFFVAVLNHYFIGAAVTIKGEPVVQMPFVDTVFYTFSIMTVLGFSSIIPDNETSKLLTVIEALGAIGWLGMLTSVFVKRFIR